MIKEDILIKRKISVGDILILIFLFVLSLGCFSVIIDEGFTGNLGVLILGSILVFVFILIFPYITFMRPYFKVSSKGLYAKLPEGFGFGVEKFYTWDKIVNNINKFNESNRLDYKKVELNDEFIKEYINTLKQFMKNADINFIGIVSYKGYLGLE